MSIRGFVLALTAALAVSSARADDARLDLGFTADESAQFLADMRAMLGSVQDILQGIGGGDRALIAEAARRSGNRMSRATPAAIRAKLPESFRAIGGPTHLMFEELAVRAETDDMDSLARFTAETMAQCAACHAAFRVH